jgi:hypothetical protein
MGHGANADGDLVLMVDTFHTHRGMLTAGAHGCTRHSILFEEQRDIYVFELHDEQTS